VKVGLIALFSHTMLTSSNSSTSIHRGAAAVGEALDKGEGVVGDWQQLWPSAGRDDKRCERGRGEKNKETCGIG
jgi:hypothetical protein